MQRFTNTQTGTNNGGRPRAGWGASAGGHELNMRALRYGMKQFFADPEIDDYNRLLVALSSYNAERDRIQRLRGEAAVVGYNPD